MDSSPPRIQTSWGYPLVLGAEQAQRLRELERLAQEAPLPMDAEARHQSGEAVPLDYSRHSAELPVGYLVTFVASYRLLPAGPLLMRHLAMCHLSGLAPEIGAVQLVMIALGFRCTPHELQRYRLVKLNQNVINVREPWSGDLVALRQPSADA